MTSLILLIWSLTLPLLLGYSIVTSFTRNKFTLSNLQKFSLSFFIGTSIFTLSLFILSLIGFQWNRFWVSAIFIVVSIILLARNGANNIYHLPKLDFINTRLNLFDIFLCLLILFKLFTIFFLALDKPVINFDAWSNWSLRAKVFYAEEGIPLDNNSSYFIGGGGHISYPLHLPIIEAWIDIVLGEWNDQLFKIISPLYLVFFVIFLYSFLARRFNRTTALVFSYLFISIPLISYHASAEYADLLVGLFIGTATMLLFDYLQTKHPLYLLFSSLMFGFSGWIKNEGVFIFLITIVFASIVFVYQMRGDKLKLSSAISNLFKRNTTLYALAGLIFLLPWILFKYNLSLGFSNLETNQDIFSKLSFHPNILPIIINNLISISNFSLLWLVFIIGVCLYWCTARTTTLTIIILLMITYLTGFIAVYLFTENYLFIINGVVMQRNLLTIAPSVFWITSLIFSIYLKKGKAY